MFEKPVCEDLSFVTWSVTLLEAGWYTVGTSLRKAVEMKHSVAAAAARRCR